MVLLSFSRPSGLRFLDSYKIKLFELFADGRLLDANKYRFLAKASPEPKRKPDGPSTSDSRSADPLALARARSDSVGLGRPGSRNGSKPNLIYLGLACQVWVLSGTFLGSEGGRE